ncbi:MAG: RNA-binding protein, partial [Bacteroidota bacterium]
MNIFVAKLHYSTDENGLREAFEQFGTVDSVKVIMDRETGRSKCFGFVEMPDDEEATNAIDNLNDQDLDGNTIVVKKAEPREDRRGGGGFNRGGGYNRGGGGGYNRGGGGYNRGGGGYG